MLPSPYHAYPGGLGIEIPEDKAGDLNYILDQITEKVAEADMSEEWQHGKVPSAMAMIETAVDYAVAFGKEK